MPSESFDISYYKNITIVRVRSQIRLIPTVIVLVRTCCETKDYLIHFYEKVTYEKFHEWLYDKQRDFTKKSYRKTVRKVRVKIMIVPAAHLLIAKYGSDGDINDDLRDWVIVGFDPQDLLEFFRLCELLRLRLLVNTTWLIARGMEIKRN